MRSYIVIPALAALNWGATAVVAVPSANTENVVARSPVSTSPSATHTRLFKHEIISRQYRAADWTSSPHELGSNHGVGKRAFVQGEVADRPDGRHWLKRRESVVVDGQEKVCVRREEIQEGGAGSTTEGNGTNGVCGRQEQLGKGKKRSPGVKGGPGPVNVQGGRTHGTKERKNRRAPEDEEASSSVKARGTHELCTKSDNTGRKTGSGRVDNAQGWGACVKEGHDQKATHWKHEKAEH